jgi:glucans biosynthesis protein C
MRKDFIDNIRIFCIMLLFPFHTCMIYNNWGEVFYITGKPFDLPSLFVTVVYPWWMTLLFTLAGISSNYAIQRRSIKEYAKERMAKLLVPLLVGLVIIIPIQSYIADVFHEGYSGGYFEHYKIFFTKFTYLTGQDGGFTPAHLWFILYLFLISMFMLPWMYLYHRSGKRIDGSKVLLLHLLPLFLVILIFTPILEIGGKSIGEALACFAIGFFLLSNEKIQERIEKNRFVLTILFLIVVLVRMLLSFHNLDRGLLWDMEQRTVTWFGILSFLGIGKRYFNHSNAYTRYLSKAAFPLYYFHQSILVVIGYFVLKYVNNIWLQFTMILFGTFGISILCYEVFRRFKISSFLFGIKFEPFKYKSKLGK